jgi:hypothetical protein
LAEPQELQKTFTGIWRDGSRDQLPPGKVHNLQDYIPDELGAPLRKRGGWEYFGSALTSLDASAELPTRMIVAPFTAGTQVLAIDGRSNCEIFDLTNDVDRGSVYGGTGGQPQGQPVFYRDQVIFPSQEATGLPRKYVSAGTLSALANAPAFRTPVVYKDRLAVANGHRIYFSGAGNAESWDVNLRYLDTSAQIHTLAALRNMMLVFHSGSVERIRGDIPPGSAAANMTLEPLYDDVGVFDFDALTVHGDTAYFADENGVYATDGNGPAKDLTKQGGISTYWTTQIASATVSVAMAVWRGYLFISLIGASDAFVDFLVYDIRRRLWFRFQNIRAYNFATRFGATDELYFSNRDTSSKRVGKLSGIFSPVSGVKNDADGDAVAPVVETGIYPVRGEGKKRFRHAYISYDLRDAASDNPTLTVSYLTDPAGTSYTALSPTLTETTARDRKRVAFGAAPTYGVAVKVAQTNASSDTRLYALETDAHLLEGSRR